MIYLLKWFSHRCCNILYFEIFINNEIHPKLKCHGSDNRHTIQCGIAYSIYIMKMSRSTPFNPHTIVVKWIDKGYEASTSKQIISTSFSELTRITHSEYKFIEKYGITIEYLFNLFKQHQNQGEKMLYSIWILIQDILMYMYSWYKLVLVLEGPTFTRDFFFYKQW